MNKKLFLIPLVILGYLFFILGIAWIIVDEPWMLDKVANEERIGMTFEKLFSEDINKSLPGYLKQIYRFFGLWVSIIGLFIIGFSKDRFIEDKSIRKTLLFCVGFTVYSALILAYKYLPSSPFIYVGWGGIFLHLISVLGHRKLN